MTSAPRICVQEVELYERDVRFRMPFRFGVVTLQRAPQLFARVRVIETDGRVATGVAAELLAPKWFDKDPAKTNEENFEQLRASVRIAATLYTEASTPRTAFRLFAEHHPLQLAECAKRDCNPLIASYGPALLDRAVLDALCRLHGLSFYDAIRANLPGIEAVPLWPERHDFDLGAFLRSLAPADTIAARHTVGLVDPLTAADVDARVGDGLPETLEEVVAAYGHTYFKLKVAGKIGQDIDRLRAIARVLDRIREPYHVTLDGNEQYESVEGVIELWDRMERTPALRRLVDSTLFIEQPIARKIALRQAIAALAARRPVIIDESDADLDAFSDARARGYSGVSSKTCKGFYKSLLNRARCEAWNREVAAPRYFMSGEDLTTQAGVAVQQDLALVALLGLTHVERNGHHYVAGMSAAPSSEQRRFLAAHPDLYADRDGVVCLRIIGGRLAIGSLACVGFATGAEPEWSAMPRMRVTTAP